jgi:glycosyltransferase involved in cell wall biosynthesis
MPKVSICLPNLNTRSFLPERLESIVAQTFQDWELIVVDNYSDDGSWEYFAEAAMGEPRMRIAQAPRTGMYRNWNNCIVAANGEYVYIATSDDTMAPDCLEKMVAALDAHTNCDIAHCPLRLIDENGLDLDNLDNWRWCRHSLFARSAPELVHDAHLRLAPFDGLLHLWSESVYISITQLLIRRSLFDRIGLFESRWGSVGDFNWNMRASLVGNTIHVPDTWASWRQHPAQATGEIRAHPTDFLQKLDESVDHALETTAHLLDQRIIELVQTVLRQWSRDQKLFYTRLIQRPTSLKRFSYLAVRGLVGDRMAWRYAFWRLTGWASWRLDRVQTVKYWLKKRGYVKMLARV